MATKNIIAICQSGGEFETNQDGTLSYKGGEAYAVDLDQKTTLKNFKKELAETFRCSVGSMVIKYFLPGNKKNLITISKDKDLKRLVNFFGNSDQVEVFVMKEEAVARNVSKRPASRSSRTTVPEEVVPAAVPVDTMVRTTLSEALVPAVVPVDTMDTDPIAMETPMETVAAIAFADINVDTNGRGMTLWEKTITGVDQRFRSFSEFLEALRNYSMANGFAYKYKKNDSRRVTVKCKTEGCPWRIYASKLATTQLVCIKTMRPTHTCEGASFKIGHRATRGWVGKIIKEKLKVSPNYKAKDIASDIKEEYGIQLTYSQAWRALETAKELLQGSYKGAYKLLPYFCQKILETNPGSIATYATKEDSSFHRLFISFQASVSGFQEGCRPLLFLDSTPLDSKYQGTLLAATAADGDDGVFPVAFAVVDADTDDNWHWFLLELKSAVSMSRPITFVADFQKGLRESLHEIFDNCQHAYCLHYLVEKLNKDLKGQFSHEARRLMVQDVYAAAYAPKLEAFEQCTGNIKAISPGAYDWVIQSEPDHWANAFFGGARYNLMTSNFGELFYSWVSEANDLPITQMVDVLRGKMMELMYARRLDSNQWGTRLTPCMEQKLQNETSKSRSFQVGQLHGNTFEVRGDSAELVDIDHWDCSCRGWQLTGLPCCHAIAVLNCLGRSPYDFCSRFFTADSYRRTYAESIHPIPNVEGPVNGVLSTSLVTVTPPPNKRRPGRPKMKQAGTLEIIKRQLQCGQCKVLGHNKKTCKALNNDRLHSPASLTSQET